MQLAKAKGIKIFFIWSICVHVHTWAPTYTHRFHYIAKLNCVTHKQNEMKECVQTAALILIPAKITAAPFIHGEMVWNEKKKKPYRESEVENNASAKRARALTNTREIIILSNYIRMLDVPDALFVSLSLCICGEQRRMNTDLQLLLLCNSLNDEIGLENLIIL